MSYVDNPRVCTECGQNLTPNYMEGRWEHFAKGCKFSGRSATSVAQETAVVPVYEKDCPEMVGQFRSEVTP